MSYDCENWKVLDLEEEIVPAGKRARSASVTSASVVFPAIPFLYQNGVLWASLETVKPDYDEYRRVHSARKESSRTVGADGVSLEEWVKQKLLCYQAADNEVMTEETPSSVLQLLQAVDRVGPVIKNGYVEYIRDLGSDPQALCWKAEDATKK